VLKNAMDYTFVEWRAQSHRLVGWGTWVAQMPQVAVEFEMAPLRHGVHILPDILRPAREGG